MNTISVKFEPTHEISYREPPDAEPEVWFVALQEDGTAIDQEGHTLFRVSGLGQWTSNPSMHLPDANLTVINLKKPKKIKKGHEPKHMPAGTILTLERQADGSWKGLCRFNDLTCYRESKGLMGLTSALCRAWLKEAGVTSTTTAPCHDPPSRPEQSTTQRPAP